MSLYRAMDRRTLDAAYNNSAAVVDSDDYIADWRERSAALRARMPAHLDLAYADKPATRLDFFSCGRPAAPTLLFFHGGYWQRNSKEGFAFVAEGPLAHGFHVAIAGYTLAPQARLDTIVSEARAAVRWLHSELAGLGGDPGGLFVSGWSAGGHLAAMSMYEPAARGGIAISGLYDLEPIRLSYLLKSCVSTAKKRAATARSSTCRRRPASSSSPSARWNCPSSGGNRPISPQPGASTA